jgi:hypothetical protein
VDVYAKSTPGQGKRLDAVVGPLDLPHLLRRIVDGLSLFHQMYPKIVSPTTKQAAFLPSNLPPGIAAFSPDGAV